MFPTPTTNGAQPLRVIPVLGDHFQPRLRHGRDFVMVAAGTGYQWEGLYALDWNDGSGPVIYRCQRRIGEGGAIRLSCENPAYSTDKTLTAEEFERVCVGMVVAELSVQAPELIREAYALHQIQPQEMAA